MPVATLFANWGQKNSWKRGGKFEGNNKTVKLAKKTAWSVHRMGDLHWGNGVWWCRPIASGGIKSCPIVVIQICGCKHGKRKRERRYSLNNTTGKREKKKKKRTPNCCLKRPVPHALPNENMRHPTIGTTPTKRRGNQKGRTQPLTPHKQLFGRVGRL